MRLSSESLMTIEASRCRSVRGRMPFSARSRVMAFTAISCANSACSRVPTVRLIRSGSIIRPRSSPTPFLAARILRTDASILASVNSPLRTAATSAACAASTSGTIRSISSPALTPSTAILAELWSRVTARISIASLTTSPPNPISFRSSPVTIGGERVAARGLSGSTAGTAMCPTMTETPGSRIAERNGRSSTLSSRARG